MRTFSLLQGQLVTVGVIVCATILVGLHADVPAWLIALFAGALGHGISQTSTTTGRIIASPVAATPRPPGAP